MADADYVKFWPSLIDRVAGLSIEAIALCPMILVLSNKIGLYRFTTGELAARLEIEPDPFKDAFPEILERLEWRYDTKSKMLFIPKWFQRNRPSNPNHFLSFKKEFKNIPENPFIDDWIESSKTFLRENCHANIEAIVLHRYPNGRGKRTTPAPAKPAEAPKPKKKDTMGKYETGFDTFYALYPRKKNRPKSLSAWKKLRIVNVNGELFQTVIRDVEAKAKTKDWMKENKSFCPYPASYLNGRMWEDEAPAGAEKIGKEFGEYDK